MSALLFNTEQLENQEKTEKVISLLSNEVLSGEYKYVIINSGNFLLGENEKEVYPLIPELYEDSTWKVVDKDKWESCFQDGTLYNTRFSFKSLQMWLDTLLKSREHPLSRDLEILPLLSVDDKYVSKEHSKFYLSQGYKSIPSIYRRLLEDSFWWAKNARAVLRIMPSILGESWQNVSNEFILSEHELVRRFFTIRKHHLDWEKHLYKEYQDSLPDKTRKCSLELFHLLKTLVNEKDRIDDWKRERLCILQFVPDACEWSAVSSAKVIVKNREDIDIISVVPVITGSDVFIVNKFNSSWEHLIS